MLTPNEKLRACVERARALPEQVRKRLEPVPTDPYEAFLMWDPEELRQDRPLTFYRKLKSKRFKAPVIYPLPVAKEDAHYTSRLHGSNRKPQYRRRVKTEYKGKMYTLLCSELTMLCILQFRRENPRINVIEHLNGDSTDDRPSNLLLSTQSANNRRSEKVMEQAQRMGRSNRGLSNQQRHEAALKRRAERKALLADQHTAAVASAHPDIETTVDLQIDLQIDKFLQQVYEPKP
jgi:hypothetical protein